MNYTKPRRSKNTDYTTPRKTLKFLDFNSNCQLHEPPQDLELHGVLQDLKILAIAPKFLLLLH
jgi:hypothetical protein